MTRKIKGPYNFDLVLDRLSLDPLHNVDKKKRQVKVPLYMNEQACVATVQAVGTSEAPEFKIECDHKSHEQVIARLTDIFQWNVDLTQIDAHFAKTSLHSIFAEHYGTPLVLDFHPYHCLLKCIVHQQLNLSFAHTLTERFVKTYGFEQDGVWFYPQAETVAALTVEQLRELQFSRRKAEYAIGVAKEVVNGRLNFAELAQQSNEEITKQLIRLRGVGPWTVQNFLMFGLGRANLFPAADIGLQNALKFHFQLDRKPTLAEIEQYQQEWEPYLSYASLYLWRSIEPK